MMELVQYGVTMVFLFVVGFGGTYVQTGDKQMADKVLADANETYVAAAKKLQSSSATRTAASNKLTDLQDEYLAKKENIPLADQLLIEASLSFAGKSLDRAKNRLVAAEKIRQEAFTQYNTGLVAYDAGLYRQAAIIGARSKVRSVAVTTVGVDFADSDIIEAQTAMDFAKSYLPQ